ncbi:MAG TPA: chemotaxis protein CheW [Arenimonas sp.]|jgi:twitching motility protein PilI|nr:chemotaxis protein CheW [Arenimonas sp.]HOZ03937.1 chemotaxis protein CheW [Arenimonas sp.]HPO23885.1 chemotaxis protein CheW [Arenimonas sp.]HPW33187.1 chemotaxis protein CheW [Arenimonas sp.]
MANNAAPHLSSFDVLQDYEQRSLVHAPGRPEMIEAAGHWRGVGYRLGKRRFVSSFDEIVEIITLPSVTAVPGANPWMLGVANVRGSLLPVVDLKQFLEGDRTVVHDGQRVLVIRQAGGNVAVLIDELFGQRTFNDTHRVEIEEQYEGRYSNFVSQVYQLNDSQWGVFNMSLLARTPEFRQAVL